MKIQLTPEMVTEMGKEWGEVYLSSLPAMSDDSSLYISQNGRNCRGQVEVRNPPFLKVWWVSLSLTYPPTKNNFKSYI